MTFKTADLYDAHGEQLSVVAPLFHRYGKRNAFSGEIVTLKCFEDNKSVREVLGRDGRGKVLVVDGGGSLRTALVGDLIAKLAVDQGWAGMVVFGCIRDSVEINALDIGIRALATNPTRPVKKVDGQADIAVSFGGVTFRPGQYLYADEDGIVVSAAPLG